MTDRDQRVADFLHLETRLLRAHTASCNAGAPGWPEEPHVTWAREDRLRDAYEHEAVELYNTLTSEEHT